MGVFVVFFPPLSATPNPDKRSDGRCNRPMGGRRGEGHNHHRMNRMARPWAPQAPPFQDEKQAEAPPVLFLLSSLHNCFRDLECARPRALTYTKRQFISQDKHRCNWRPTECHFWKCAPEKARTVGF